MIYLKKFEPIMGKYDTSYNSHFFYVITNEKSVFFSFNFLVLKVQCFVPRFNLTDIEITPPTNGKLNLKKIHIKVRRSRNMICC